MAKPHGKLIKVKGKNMHVRQMGSGGKTIVLLPGLNDSLPSVDFAPLMRELSKKYTVCAVEFFGYGHSDSTDTPRTNENYVVEIREALSLAGLKPPYVLMPYSASGIYAEYYAAKYPQEIEGLILLDSTPTVEAVAKEFAYTPDDIEKMQASLEDEDTEETEYDENAINEAIAEYVLHGYTVEELEEIAEVENHIGTIIAQDMALSDNIFEVLSLPIPKDIPILAFSSDINELLEELEDEGLSESEKQREVAEYEKRLKDHMGRLGEHAKLVVIEKSTHGDIAYNRDYRKILSREIDKFLKLFVSWENDDE